MVYTGKKRGPKPKASTTITPFIIETGVPLPRRGTTKETKIFHNKLRPILQKMKPLVNSVPIPKKNKNTAASLIRKEFGGRIYQISPIPDNPNFVRIFRKK